MLSLLKNIDPGKAESPTDQGRRSKTLVLGVFLFFLEEKLWAALFVSACAPQGGTWIGWVPSSAVSDILFPWREEALLPCLLFLLNRNPSGCCPLRVPNKWSQFLVHCHPYITPISSGVTTLVYCGVALLVGNRWMPLMCTFPCISLQISSKRKPGVTLLHASFPNIANSGN